jgi:hypothetical protein
VALGNQALKAELAQLRSDIERRNKDAVRLARQQAGERLVLRIESGSFRKSSPSPDSISKA